MRRKTSEEDTSWGCRWAKPSTFSTATFHRGCTNLDRCSPTIAGCSDEVNRPGCVSVRDVAAAIITLALGAVLSVIRPMAHRPPGSVN
jgi:hypothetical protein